MEKGQTAVDQVFLELTNHCNFSCSFCATGQMQRKRGFMDTQLALRLLGEISEEKLASRVLFHVMGEPLLHPRLANIVRYARGLGLSPVVYTNGSLLHTAKATRVLESGLTELVISLHSKDSRHHELRKADGIRYEDYLSRICNFIEARYSKAVETTIRLEMMNTLGSNYKILDSEDDVLSFIRWWASFLRTCGLDPDDDPAESFISGFKRRDYVEHKLLNDFVVGLKPMGRWVNAKEVAAAKKAGIVAYKGICSALQSHFTVLWNGDFDVCCSDYDGENVLGNVSSIRLGDLWADARVQKARMDFRDGLLALPYCLICESVPKFKAIYDQ
jgi:sulfatase maturation enzyme AslB (radical SAM superfamily)